MSDDATWRASIEASGAAIEGLEKPVEGHPTARYPLLGDSAPKSPERASTPSAWRLRLDLSRAERTVDWSDEELAFLLEDVDELELGTDRDPRLVGFAGVSIIAPDCLPDEKGDGTHRRASDWTPNSSASALLTPLLDGCWQRTVSSSDGSRLEEFAFACDRAILKNVAIISRLSADLGDDQRATLILDGSATREPEELVGQTLRALVGVFSGVSTLAVRACHQEAPQQLAWRMNILRLLKCEADLGTLQHPFEGAPFFEELGSRLLEG